MPLLLQLLHGSVCSCRHLKPTDSKETQGEHGTQRLRTRQADTLGDITNDMTSMTDNKQHQPGHSQTRCRALLAHLACQCCYRQAVAPVCCSTCTQLLVQYCTNRHSTSAHTQCLPTTIRMLHASRTAAALWLGTHSMQLQAQGVLQRTQTLLLLEPHYFPSPRSLLPRRIHPYRRYLV